MRPRVELEARRPSLRWLLPRLSASYDGAYADGTRARLDLALIVDGDDWIKPWLDLRLVLELTRREDALLDVVLPDRRPGGERGWFRGSNWIGSRTWPLTRR